MGLSFSFGSSSEMSSELLVFTDSSVFSSISSGSSLSSAGPDCDLFEIHPRGREGIGVVQPRSGVDYPLISPSEDVRYLLADLYLEYAGDYQLPFHIAYLHGFGCLEGTPAGIPPHALTGIPNNIVIADNAGQIVFDSRDAEPGPTTPYNLFTVREWGPRNHIYEWRTEDGICRLVTHTRWSPDEDPPPRQYRHHLVPQRAIIDDRALLQLPRRVQTLQVLMNKIQRQRVLLSNGYNMELTHADTAAPAGGRVVHQIRFDATPATGLGIFPGCIPPPLTINRINGVDPSDAGDFSFSAKDCFFVRQPTAIGANNTTIPVTEVSPGNTVEENLPDPLAGKSIMARGWPHEKDKSHLIFGDDCKPCCDCDDYMAVAKYMNRARNDYKEIGNSLMATRGVYHSNRQRFLDAARCFKRHPLRIFMQPQICPFLDVALQFSNQTDQCITDLHLTVGFQVSPTPSAPPVEVPGFTRITGAARRLGRTTGLTELYRMSGLWPMFTAYWDTVEPYAAVSVRFRLEFPDCFTPTIVTGSLSGTIIGTPIEIPRIGSSASDGLEEAVVTDTKTLNCPATHDDVHDTMRCYREYLASSSESAFENP
jgi:hypothetical protein